MNAIPPFDADLLRRYDRPGPRYTSYPTAPQFGPEFDETAFREQARRSRLIISVARAHHPLGLLVGLMPSSSAP